MIVGFTGTRQGMSVDQFLRVGTLILSIDACFPVTEFHHGDCVGSDRQADTVAHALDLAVVLHPPLPERLRAFCTGADRVLEPLPYLARNRAIVDACDVLIAAPSELEGVTSSGTWYTVNYARSSGVASAVVYRDGSVALGRADGGVTYLPATVAP